MTSTTAVFSAAPPIISPISTINNRIVSPMSISYAYDYSATIRNANNKQSNPPHHRIKSSASDSMSTVDTPTPASDSKEEDENPVKIGARVRVKVPLMVYHIPRVSEVELKGKEGKVKENVAVWRGKQISANFPYKIEFLEKLDGRGDAPVKFVAHLREDEFEFIH